MHIPGNIIDSDVEIKESCVLCIGTDPITIARVARVSYNRDEKDATVEQLVNRVIDLYRLKHMSVFEHNAIYMYISMDKAYIKDFLTAVYLLRTLLPGSVLELAYIRQDSKTDKFVHIVLYTQLRTILRILEHLNKIASPLYTIALKLTQIAYPALDSSILTDVIDFDFGGKLYTLIEIQKTSRRVYINDNSSANIGCIDFLFWSDLLRMNVTEHKHISHTSIEKNKVYETILAKTVDNPVDSLFSVIVTNCNFKQFMNLSQFIIPASDYSLYAFRIKAPIYVARQWMRHRHAAYNELSRRYVSEKLEFCSLVSNYKNNIDKEIIDRHQILDRIYRDNITRESKEMYNMLLTRGLKKETARAVLPLSLMTKFIWTVPKYSLQNFITLRTDKHAQYEIRLFAQAIQNQLCL